MTRQYRSPDGIYSNVRYSVVSSESASVFYTAYQGDCLADAISACNRVRLDTPSRKAWIYDHLKGQAVTRGQVRLAA